MYVCVCVYAEPIVELCVPRPTSLVGQKSAFPTLFQCVDDESIIRHARINPCFVEPSQIRELPWQKRSDLLCVPPFLKEAVWVSHTPLSEIVRLFQSTIVVLSFLL